MTDVPRTRWARTIDGACIAYQDIGEGPITLVVIHGWVSHLEVYWEQPRYARFIRRLSRNLRVLLFDKRGIGMSDRVNGTPDLGVLLDDVRAVMDAAGVARAALLGWGSPGPGLAAFFAATYPERTLCLLIDGWIHFRRESDHPHGETAAEFEKSVSALSSTWGLEDRIVDFVRQGYGERPDDAPYDDLEFLRWNAKLARFAATPASYETFMRMWFETDLRPVLPTIHVPTAIFFKRTQSEEDLEIMGSYLETIPGARRVDVDARDLVVWLDDHEQYASALERYLASVANEEAQLDRMLATVLFTDIVGSTARAAELGDARWQEFLERHHKTVRALLARYRGIEVKTMGDGFLATFDGPARAVKCAQVICEAVKPLGLEVRAGCHTGEIELLGADVGGIAVHIGARVGALAAPSEVLVSSTVKDLVAGSGLIFADRGEHELKGMPGSWHLYSADT
ncbi:MAG: adenylate/guanylate cyclase domain-containing protein [Actinobacteria bacterium]|nr:adenylate/guanylate cyclase domain-containing protein [Actinomycetota bacterium]